MELWPALKYFGHGPKKVADHCSRVPISGLNCCFNVTHFDLVKMIHILVAQRIDYCDALYMGLPLKSLWKLQLHHIHFTLHIRYQEILD